MLVSTFNAQAIDSRSIELIFERRTLLHRNCVWFPWELVANHLQVAVDHFHVPIVGCIANICKCRRWRRVANTRNRFVQRIWHSRFLHGLPQFRVFVADWIFPHGQFGSLDGRHRVVQRQSFPDVMEVPFDLSHPLEINHFRWAIHWGVRDFVLLSQVL